MCRKKKIKCDGKMPACSHCINYKTECVFTQVEKKRNPPKGCVCSGYSAIGKHTNAEDRAKYIEGLENRLGRMESLLKLSGLLNEEDDRTDLGTLEKRLVDKTQNLSNGATPKSTESTPHPSASSESRHNTPQQERRASSGGPMASPNPEKRNEEEVEALSDMMCSLVTNNHGETRYIGQLSLPMSTFAMSD